MKKGRLYNAPWKGLYGTDRGYTARVDRAKARGQFTEPGTPGGAVNPAKADKRRRRKTLRAAA